MTSVQQRFLDTIDASAQRRTSRRSLLVTSAKLATGGVLALTLVGAPGLDQFAAAQDDNKGVGGGGRTGGGGKGSGGRSGGGNGQGAGNQGGVGGGAAMPTVGTGSSLQPTGSKLPGAVGVAAAGAAAIAILARRGDPAKDAANS